MHIVILQEKESRLLQQQYRHYRQFVPEKLKTEKKGCLKIGRVNSDGYEEAAIFDSTNPIYQSGNR